MLRHSLAAILILSAAPLVAQQAQDPALKLREQLRSTMLQLRTAQTEASNMQASLAAAEAKTAELEEKIKTLDKRYETLVKDANTAKVSAEESIATLNNKLADREERIIRYNEALEKWKAGYQKAAEVARTKESERSALASEIISLKRTIADRETKNVALFNTSNEILDRLENYALGKALAAREPFIGSTRVKVENMVQGYKDRIVESRISAPARNP